MATCPSCQASVSPDAWFCAHCGTSLKSPSDLSSPSVETPAVTPPPINTPPAVDPYAPTNVAGLEDNVEQPVAATEVVSPGENAAAPTVPSTDIPPTEVVSMAPPEIPGPDASPSVTTDIPPTEVVGVPPAPPANIPVPEVGNPPPIAPALSQQPPDLLATPEASPPPLEQVAVESTAFPDTGAFEPPSAADVIAAAESQPGNIDVPSASPPPLPTTPAPVSPPPPSPLESPVSSAPPQAPPTTPAIPSAPPAATSAQNEMTPATPIGATQIQQPTARLVHIRSDVAVAIPSHLHVVHIGKPNDRVPPDLDMSGFADSDVVSRVHADLRAEADGYYLEDTGSANGTYVNNQALRPGDRYRLRTGDRVSLGKEDKVSFIFHA